MCIDKPVRGKTNCKENDTDTEIIIKKIKTQKKIKQQPQRRQNERRTHVN